MEQILNVYRLVKLVEQISEEESSKRPIEEVVWVGRSYHAPVAAPLKHKFAGRYDYSYQRVDDICDDALVDKYLSVSARKGPKNKVEVFIVTTKGRELIDTAFWVVPIGLLNAWWNRYGVFTTGFVAGLILPALILVVKWLFDRLL